MLDKLFDLSLYFGSVCIGVLAMLLASRWTPKEWPLWWCFFLVAGFLMVLLRQAGIRLPA